MRFGVHPDQAIGRVPYLQIRRCTGSGALQIAAWSTQQEAPALLFDLKRFSIGQIVVTGNLVVVVAPGPYDVVVVVRYAKGKPEQVFAESTRGEISVLSTGNRVTVEIGSTENTPSKTRAFEVDEDELRRG